MNTPLSLLFNHTLYFEFKAIQYAIDEKTTSYCCSLPPTSTDRINCLVMMMIVAHNLQIVKLCGFGRPFGNIFEIEKLMPRETVALEN